MTTNHSASNYVSISTGSDLPCPETQVSETSPNTEASIARPAAITPANIRDSGRIRYGSIARMPVAR